MKLDVLLDKVIPALGYELVDLEITSAKLIRVFIDKPDGVTIHDCEMVSNHLNRLFFVEEIDYNRLEVSSPGVERPLKKLDDFLRFTGKLAKIKTRELIEEQKVFQGLILGVEGDMVKLELINNGEVRLIELTNISRARLVFENTKNLKISKNYRKEYK